MSSELFESCVRTKGDLAGVFEFDGDAGYFYLYDVSGAAGSRVLDSIRVLAASPDFTESEVGVRWDVAEVVVGLFIRDELRAAFDSLTGAKYGGRHCDAACAGAGSLRYRERVIVPTQRLLCLKYNAGFFPSPIHLKVGIARNVREGLLPLNGLRHAPDGDTTGWYIWAGGEPSSDADFFVPLHVEHLAEWCPAVLPFLGLPPGWRFLVAGDHEDVWQDSSLLDG
jgi:hypothetical protein